MPWDVAISVAAALAVAFAAGRSEFITVTEVRRSPDSIFGKLLTFAFGVGMIALGFLFLLWSPGIVAEHGLPMGALLVTMSFFIPATVGVLLSAAVYEVIESSVSEGSVSE
jgi:hypothetical protein